MNPMSVTHNSLYCVTCKTRICDGCNDTFSSDQLKLFKETEKPFYCLYCDKLYPCKICKKQCYNDIVHAPSIYCDSCHEWLHHGCSKLTYTQFNKLGNGDQNYYCHVCMAENVPFAKLSKNAFTNVVVDCSPHTSAIRMNASICTLCIECNQNCDECQICPDMHRVCSGCSSNCKYLTVKEYNENVAKSSSKQNQLKLLHVNIRSLPKHITNISNLIYNDFDTSLDVICFSETKLEDPEPTGSNDSNIINSNFDLDNVQLPGYDFVHNPSATNAGGTGIYVSQLYSVIKRPDLNIQIEGECEACFIEIVVDKQCGKNVIVGSLYRHPHDNFDEFFSAFAKIVEKINKKYQLIILGDFNINMIDYTSPTARTYKNLLLSLGLRNVINLPTRVTESTETVIDHCITNVPSADIKSGVIQEDISDHFPIHAVANLSLKKPKLPSHHFRRRFPHSKKQKFLDLLKARLENFPDPVQNPVSSFDNFISTFQLVANQIFPVTKLSCKERKRYKHPWITAGILKSCDRRFVLLKRSLELKTQEAREEYTRYRNKLTHTIEAAKANFHGKGFEEIGNDIKKTWKKINDMKNTNLKPRNCLPEKLVVDKTVIQNAKDIANHLNKHFVEKGQNLASKLPKPKTTIYKTLGARNPCSMTFKVITETEVVNIVIDFDNKKSTGVDGIPSILIKWSIHIIAPILTKLFNIFVNMGVYPDSLKVAKVTPLHKKRDKTIDDNFRPISVLTQINKIFEKLIHERLVTFTNEHSILPNNQFGFRKKHSASHGITHLNEQVTKNLESKKISAVLFMDLKSAFDTVNHNILIRKLDHYGIRNNVLDLLISYLTNRKQFVKSGEIESCLYAVICGVPQGSVLGPLLFILYITDIVNCSKFECFLFADDAGLLLADEKIKTLKKAVNAEVKLLYDWLITNKLTLNFTKTNYMLISNINKLSVKDRKKFRVTIGKYTIHEVEQTKYLGVILDNKLSWKEHIEYLITKLSQAAGVIYKLRKYLPYHAKMLIYDSLAASYLRYSISAWGNTTQSLLARLKSAQNKIIRYMTFSPPMSNVEDKYKSLKILDIQNLYFFEVAKFMHSVFHKKTPNAFGDYFHTISHSYNTRNKQANTFSLPQPRTERGKRSLKYNGIEIWAKVPEQLKNLEPKQFRFQLKEYIFANLL